LGEFIGQNTRTNARLAVIGSEPELYFYSHRRSATGYIYVYPLMEKQRFAGQMQEEMIREIETAQPEYIVHVSDPLSWLQREDSQTRILEWWEQYRPAHYEMVKLIPLLEPVPKEEAGGVEGQQRQRGYLMLLERKK
jgi:hypothetical protein